MRSRLWLVLIVTMLAGCASDVAAPTTSAAPTTAATTTSTSTRAGGGAVLNLPLRTDGLGSLSFGDPTDDVVAALQTAYGPVLERGGIDCPSGSDEYVTFGGLFTIHDDGRWAGWSYGTGGVAPVADLATDEGITLGATVSDLRASFGTDLDVFEDTLGPEFFVGTDYPGLGGFLTGTDDSDTITILYAGDLCAFR